jgi:hypothetical protein
MGVRRSPLSDRLTTSIMAARATHNPDSQPIRRKDSYRRKPSRHDHGVAANSDYSQGYSRPDST